MDRDKFIILLVCTVIASFLGAFVASMFLFGGGYRFSHRQHYPLFEGMNAPVFHGDFDDIFDRNQQIMEKQQKVLDDFDDNIEDMMEKASKTARFISVTNSGLKTQETNDAYKLIINLKPFNNDEKNVKMVIRGNKIFISAHYKVEDDDDFASSEFNQMYAFPSKIDPSKVKQRKENNSLVIIIPKK